MHRIYSLKRGIEFRWDVRDLIKVIMIIAIVGFVITHIEDILTVMIAGF